MIDPIAPPPTREQVLSYLKQLSIVIQENWVSNNVICYSLLIDTIIAMYFHSCAKKYGINEISLYFNTELPCNVLTTVFQFLGNLSNRQFLIAPFFETGNQNVLLIDVFDSISGQPIQNQIDAGFTIVERIFVNESILKKFPIHDRIHNLLIKILLYGQQTVNADFCQRFYKIASTIFTDNPKEKPGDLVTNVIRLINNFPTVVIGVCFFHIILTNPVK
jgi:hypothetical protein